MRSPYLLFLGDIQHRTDAKTALGLAQWRRELCLGQLRLGSVVGTGLPDMTPAEAAAAGARSLIVGVAPVGGSFPEPWIDSLVRASPWTPSPPTSSPLPLCADESCVHVGELAQTARRYQMVNLKLDKSGGLTHGLEMARKARELGIWSSPMGVAVSFLMASQAEVRGSRGPPRWYPLGAPRLA